MTKIHNIFISHSWSYSDAYEKLHSMLTSRPNFMFRNYSVPKDNPIHNAPSSRALYEAIRQQMQSCHVVLIMAGKYATFSEWMIKEISIAKNEFSQPKPIVAIKPWAALQTSTIVTQNCDEIVGWNTESIISAIRKVSLNQ